MYKPTAKTEAILSKAWQWVQSVPYQVSLRWVFYRLFQDGTFNSKKNYGTLKYILSVARKEFYGTWRPWTLADDTRAARTRRGFATPGEWAKAVAETTTYWPDHFQAQPSYVEIWFEAAAMEAQFLYYAPAFVPLLAFRGDCSIPEKWKAATRLVERFLELEKNIVVFYYGDLDPKGLLIPDSAWRDIQLFSGVAFMTRLKEQGVAPAEWDSRWERSIGRIRFQRVGLTEEQVARFGLPENPERPGTWQWEALSDGQARTLIEHAWTVLNAGVYEQENIRAERITRAMQEHLGGFVVPGQ